MIPVMTNRPDASSPDPGRPVPTLGIDLDGCCDEAPAFFGTLTHVWPGSVVVITLRDDRDKAIRDLARLGIRYDRLELMRRMEEKAEVIARVGVDLYIDDQPETLQPIPETVRTLLFRNGGNYDFDQRKWILSDRTGRLI